MSEGPISQMVTDDERMTRYLLGEMSEAEQTELERRFFADTTLVDRMIQVEAQLLDEHARGRLTSEVRGRIAQQYLAHPQRRARLKFAAALAAKLDQLAASSSVGPPESAGQILRPWWQGPSRVAGFSLALASLVLMVTAGWLLVDRIRLREELTRTQTARVTQETRARELQEQLVRQQADTRTLATEVDRLRAAPDASSGEPRPVPATPTIVSLLLTIGGVRAPDADAVRTLRVPPGTSLVRFQMNLRDNDHQRYQVVLQAVSGNTILDRQDLRPEQTPSGWRLLVTAPAARVRAGDYVLTLRGVTRDGDLDEVSKTIVRVEY